MCIHILAVAFIDQDLAKNSFLNPQSRDVKSSTQFTVAESRMECGLGTPEWKVHKWWMKRNVLDLVTVSSSSYKYVSVNK